MGEKDFRCSIFDVRLDECWRRPFVLFVLFVLSNSSSTYADEALTIARIERWSSVFAESESRWTYRVSAERPFQERAAWRLTANQRTLSSGELEVRGQAGQPGNVTLPLRWPKVKEGTALAAQLSVSAGDVRHEHAVWIFSRNAFSDRRDWLSSLHLKVFDPQGETVEVFNEHEIPHEQIRSRETINEVVEGILVVGEGVSLKKQDGLIDDLRNLANRGVPVLCLASSEGEFSFSDDKPLALAIQLRRSDVIREFDKRLDTAWWPKGASQLRGLQVGSAADEVVFEINDDGKSWPWCEWQFKNRSEEFDQPTRLIWCGFGIIHSWDNGPTPRYLLIKILERLALESNETVLQPLTEENSQ